jgi:hypothetical protein
MNWLFDPRVMVRIKIERILREKEIARFDRLLAGNQARLIVLSGEDGTGKSSLLRTLQLGAGERHWRIAPNRAYDTLSIEKETTSQSFSDRVAGMLELPVTSAVADSRGESPGGQTRRRDSPLVEALLRGATQATPAAIFIDGYEPAEEFSHWFSEIFVREWRQSGACATIVVADRRQNVAALLPLADEHLVLAHPDRNAMKAALDRLSGQMDPPLEAPEAAVYLEKTAGQPRLFRYLIRALMLSQIE